MSIETCIAAETTTESSAPNIVLIIADDMGWGDLGIHGNTNLETPHIDSLGHEGAKFENFYVCAVCAPTRSELLTGRDFLRTGVRGVSRGEERINLDEVTVADLFSKAGYQTGAFGKWHSGTQYPYHPLGRGFGEFYGFTHGHWANYFNTKMDHNGEMVKGKGFIIDDLTNHAIDFIKENQAKPFFCYVPMNTPHSPWQVPDKFWNKFKDAPIKLRNCKPSREELDKTRCALAMCENIDWNVGRILKKLDELKLDKRTIVLFMSDNGPNSWRFNGGMLGKKGSIDEGGLRSPLLVRYPGKIKPGTQISQIAGAIDLLPTLTDLCSVKCEGTKPLDGKSLRPLLLGEKRDWPDRMLFSGKWNGSQVTVRTQQYRASSQGKLYDIQADRGQLVNLAKKKPEVYKKLSTAMQAWKRDVLDGSQAGSDRPLTVGYSKMPKTQLPARDATTVGKIGRSSRHPNASFFKDWTDPQGEIHWKLDVKRAGRYEVELLYTCRKQDVGCVLELVYGETKLPIKITEVHDPKLLPSPDHSPRSESYEKVFKVLDAGTIKLTKGQGTLRLCVKKKTGKRLPDIEEIRLKLLP